MQNGKNGLKKPEINLSECFYVSMKCDCDNVVGLEDNQSIKLANFTINVIDSQGHSDSSCCYDINNSLFTGDTIFKGVIGRTDLYLSSGEQMILSLKKIDKLKPFDRYYPGHGVDFDYQDLRNTINLYIKFGYLHLP